jgi:hypothetical protein
MAVLAGLPFMKVFHPKRLGTEPNVGAKYLPPGKLKK